MADHGHRYEITTLEKAHEVIEALEQEVAEARGISEGRRKAVVRIYEALGGLNEFSSTYAAIAKIEAMKKALTLASLTIEAASDRIGASFPVLDTLNAIDKALKE